MFVKEIDKISLNLLHKIFLQSVFSRKKDFTKDLPFEKTA